VPNFFQYAYARCEKIKGSVSFGTYKNYTLYTKKFENYVGSKDVYFDDITVSVLKELWQITKSMLELTSKREVYNNIL
jgi:hypothetical protein